MKWTCVVAGVLWMAASAASASDVCPVPSGVVQVALPSGLPAELSKAVGEIALPGEPFDTIDVYVKGDKHRRYLFVWHSGNRWIVAAEVGGIALRASVSVYDLSKKDKLLVEERMTVPSGACAVATQLSGH
jgi:hypothetical protein